MYEELIQRLRETSMEFGEVDHVSVMLLEAADVIEEEDMNFRHLERDYKDLCRYLPKWIPATERLPEEGVSVQVCFHSQGGKAQAVSERFVDNRNQSYWPGLCGMKPTHWMPLPEPPKEE